MKKILFPATNRVHIARQGQLIDELRKHFEVHVEGYQSQHKDMLNAVADCANHFRHVLKNGYDLVLVRGDRFEVLPIAMLAAYRGIPLAHIEGGDLSGAIDNKVRYAITALSDIHFATNKESFSRLISMGTNPDQTFNFGSLDVEFAKTIFLGNPRKNNIVVCFHPMPGEDFDAITSALQDFMDGNIEITIIKSNSDNGRSYGTEEYSPEEYLKLIAEAGCLVGNSSSFIKEASVFGTPVVNVGSRQRSRLKSANVMDTPCDAYHISKAIELQLGREYPVSNIYWKPDTSKRICEKIKEYLG